MDWANISISTVVALLLAVGLPMMLRRRQKVGQANTEGLLTHLTALGVGASLVDDGGGIEKTGMGRVSAQRSEGLIALKQRRISFVNVVSQTSQYAVEFFLDYLVKRPDWAGQRKRKKTRMVAKRSRAIGGTLVDVQWKGDDSLSQALNLDYRLKDRLLEVGLGELKGGITIFDDPKHEYGRIRTAYRLPSASLLEALDIIAGHVASAG